MANNKFQLSKEHQFDITITDNTYAGKLSLPYVTAAVKSPDTVAKAYVRQIDGLNSKAVVSNLGITDVIQKGGNAGTACDFEAGTALSLTEQVLTLSDLKVNEQICRATVFPTWIGENMARNGNLPVDFSSFLLGTVAAKAGAQIENLLWSSSATAGLFGVGFLSNDGVFDEDGFNASACKSFTRIQYGTGAADLTAATVDDAFAEVFAQVVGTHPGLMDKAGFGFYVNNKTYGFYAQYLLQSGQGQGINVLGTNQGMDGFTYLGYPVYRCPGIPDNVILATYTDNLVFGTNLATDWTEVRLIPTYEYDGSDNIRIVMNFAIGVQTAVATDGVVGSNVVVS